MMVPLHKQRNFCFVPLFVALAVICASKAVEVSFQQNYKVTWGMHHVFFLNNGREVQLSIDKTSGAGFKSKLNYASGFFQMRIKIPNKDSRGIVTAFYLSSKAFEHLGGNHDEIDFEFLGNNGKPYILQTNVFVSDEGGREQRHSLWFDPTIDFHTYGILWNQHQIVFYVDQIPIRVFKNKSNIGVSFPSHQMHITVSIWNGEPWASNGKRIDWKQAPFIAQFQGFNIHGCQSKKHNKHVCHSPNLWWNDKKHWEPVVNAFTKRLALWKSRFISLGGRVVLIKSVLSSLPLYFFSFYRVPKKVLKKLIGIQRNFLWGGSVLKKKVAWVAWNQVCKSKLVGGLGIKNLEVFNLSLLAKWRWRLLSGEDSLWRRIIMSKYHTRGLIVKSNSKSSMWWKDMCKLSSCYDSRDWFVEAVKRCVGKGDQTLFWDDVWLELGCLKELYPRLYSLSLEKDKTVAELGSWMGDTWCWKFQWRRPFFDWETELKDEMLGLLQSFSIKRDLADKWIWSREISGNFTTNSAYEYIQSVFSNCGGSQSQVSDSVFNKFWVNSVPVKVLSFSWQLMLDRIPTKSNLSVRNILHSDVDLKCAFCDVEVENSKHLLLSCPFSSRVWAFTFHWLGVQGFADQNLRSHFLQFLSLFSGNKEKKIGVLVWHAVAWCLWNLRNDIIFNNCRCDFTQVVDRIKSLSWHWFCSVIVKSAVIFSDWCCCPFMCIRIGASL